MKSRIQILASLLTALVLGTVFPAHAQSDTAAQPATVASAASSPPAGDGQPQVLDRIVAVVNNGVILQSQLVRAIRVARVQMRQRGINPPPATALQSQVLEQLVAKKIQVQAAENAGIKVNDAELNEAVQAVAKQNNMTVPQFKTELEKSGIDFNDVRHQIRDEIMIQQLRQKAVDQRIVVTDQDVNLFLSNHAHQDNNAEYRLSYILVAVPENASERQRQTKKAKAEKLLEKLHQGADFAQLAIADSDGPQALKGGDLGWRKADDLPTMFSDIVPDMKVGQISSLISTANGYYIVKLTDKRSSGKRQTVVETHAEHILLTPNTLRDGATTKALAEKLYQKLKNGANFDKLAEKYSDDPGSKDQGGDLGWQPPGSFVPTFEKQLNKLQPGQISKPFKTRFGWHIVKLLGRRTRDVTEQVRRNQARQAILRSREQEAYQSWLQRLRDDAYINIRLKPGMITDAEVDRSDSGAS